MECWEVHGHPTKLEQRALLHEERAKQGNLMARASPLVQGLPPSYITVCCLRAEMEEHMSCYHPQLCSLANPTNSGSHRLLPPPLPLPLPSSPPPHRCLHRLVSFSNLIFVLDPLFLSYLQLKTGCACLPCTGQGGDAGRCCPQREGTVLGFKLVRASALLLFMRLLHLKRCHACDQCCVYGEATFLPINTVF
jgi:hypothetical protein